MNLYFRCIEGYIWRLYGTLFGDGSGGISRRYANHVHSSLQTI